MPVNFDGHLRWQEGIFAAPGAGWQITKTTNHGQTTSSGSDAPVKQLRHATQLRMKPAV
jgi:hypothetical protein